jgi:hypothetical protein
MLPNAWRNFQILVYLTFIPLIMVKILPVSRTIGEILINIGMMGYMLVGIHGIRIAISILKPMVFGLDPEIPKALDGLYDMEGGFDG